MLHQWNLSLYSQQDWPQLVCLAAEAMVYICVKKAPCTRKKSQADWIMPRTKANLQQLSMFDKEYEFWYLCLYKLGRRRCLFVMAVWQKVYQRWWAFINYAAKVFLGFIISHNLLSKELYCDMFYNCLHNLYYSMLTSSYSRHGLLDACINAWPEAVLQTQAKGRGTLPWWLMVGNTEAGANEH